jgi:hypothetical protein
MVVKFNRDVIYIRFLPTAETDDLRVSWAVLFGRAGAADLPVRRRG